MIKIHFKILCFYTALVFIEKYEKAYDITKKPYLCCAHNTTLFHVC